MKYFLLIAGDNYYPQMGCEDWQGIYSSYEEAKDAVKSIEHTKTTHKGNKKEQSSVVYNKYIINNNQFDWFEIIDLKQWILK